MVSQDLTVVLHMKMSQSWSKELTCKSLAKVREPVMKEFRILVQ
jgi:hypothetical protein